MIIIGFKEQDNCVREGVNDIGFKEHGDGLVAIRIIECLKERFIKEIQTTQTNDVAAKDNVQRSDSQTMNTGIFNSTEAAMACIYCWTKSTSYKFASKLLHLLCSSLDTATHHSGKDYRNN